MKVSVITVTFNSAQTVERTLRSVLQQSGVDFEYVVVDGASSDGTLEILERYRDSIAALSSEPDQGIYDAMNKAIKKAQGDYILFMNAGDIFLCSESLSQMTLLIDNDTTSEQVIWGSWLVQSSPGVQTVREPNVVRGLFNHQATLYSRSIHSWHGDYVTVRGLTASDFLFFRTLQARNRVRFQTTKCIVAIVDPFGVSAGLQTYLQRVLVDMLCGYESRYRGITKIALHPFYNKLKHLITRT